VTLLAGCSAGGTVLPGASAEGASGASDQEPGASAAPAAVPADVTLETSIANRATGVTVDTPYVVAATGGVLAAVTVSGSGEEGQVAGDLSESRWSATGGLEPGTTYDVTAQVLDDTGREVTRRSSFTTQDLSLSQQTFASVAPLQGETVGVGMPVVVSFDVPVTDRASIEQHLSVQTTPVQRGTWRWVSDSEVHYRPASYWQPGTQVTVDLAINGVSAGAGIYGQESRTIDFLVGDANVYKVDAAAHQMKVFSDGELLRTLPITTGKAGFTTRSGTKIIMEKFESKRMNSETVGIAAGSAESYDIDNVQYAMRVTSSGEFIHAAPWSVGSQGSANVSHGCTGMSTNDAAWLYAMSKRGDVVEYTGTDRPMTLDNGYGDWNETFKQAKAASALG